MNEDHIDLNKTANTVYGRSRDRREGQVYIRAQPDYWGEPRANTPTPEYLGNAKHCMQCQFFRMFLVNFFRIFWF